MRFFTMLMLALSLTVVVACGNETETATAETETPTEVESTDPATLGEFRVQLEDLTGEYLALKNAFVQSDLAAVTSAGANFGNAFDEINAGSLNGLDRGDWERLSQDIGEHGKSIAAATELEAARQQFSLLTPAMIEAIKRFNVNDETLYVQYCPMAFDNAGATWISAEKEIRNPYFGDAMLTCGKVQEELAAE